MPQVQIDDRVFQAAQRRAAEGGYASVDAYITDVVAHDLVDGEETPDLDHRFTPEVVSDLERISANANGGGKTYTSEQVGDYFRAKSKG